MPNDLKMFGLDHVFLGASLMGLHFACRRKPPWVTNVHLGQWMAYGICQSNAPKKKKYLGPVIQRSVDVLFRHASTLPALSALTARGSNKVAATRTRDTTGTGHRLKAFEDLRCQTDRTGCEELILLSSKTMMECLCLKPKPRNLISAF